MRVAWRSPLVSFNMLANTHLGAASHYFDAHRGIGFLGLFYRGAGMWRLAERATCLAAKKPGAAKAKAVMTLGGEVGVTPRNLKRGRLGIEW